MNMHFFRRSLHFYGFSSFFLFMLAVLRNFPFHVISIIVYSIINIDIFNAHIQWRPAALFDIINQTGMQCSGACFSQFKSYVTLDRNKLLLPHRKHNACPDPYKIEEIVDTLQFDLFYCEHSSYLWGFGDQRKPTE